MKVVKKLKKADKYLSDFVDREMELNPEKEQSAEKFIKSLKNLAAENSKHIKTKKNSLEAIRDIRYRGKY